MNNNVKMNAKKLNQLIQNLIYLKEYLILDKLYTSDIIEKIINQSIDCQNPNYFQILELEKLFFGTNFHQSFVKKALLKLKIQNIDGKRLEHILKEERKRKQHSLLAVKKATKKKNKIALKSDDRRKKALKMPDFSGGREDAMAPWRLFPGSYGSGK